jgi:hypothetical protein
LMVCITVWPAADDHDSHLPGIGSCRTKNQLPAARTTLGYEYGRRASGKTSSHILKLNLGGSLAGRGTRGREVSNDSVVTKLAPMTAGQPLTKP